MRTDELDDPVDGSTTTACVECGSDVWISPESRKQLSKVGAMPLCGRCAVRVAQEADVTELSAGGMTQGQFDEIKEGLRAKHPGLMALLDQDERDNFEMMKATAVMAADAIPYDQVGAEFGSMCVMEDYEGMTYPPVPISDMLRGGVPEEVVAKQLLPACIQAAGAKVAFLGICAWKVSSRTPLTVAPSEHPDRQEKILIIEITADGVQRMSEAAVMRDGLSKPKLGEWRDSKSEPVESYGLFVDAIVPTLQLVRSLRGE